MTSVELINELTELKESYSINGIDLNTIEQAFCQLRSAHAWLRQNRANQEHPQTADYKNVVVSTHELAAKHKKLLANITKPRHKTQAGLNFTNV